MAAPASSPVDIVYPWLQRRLQARPAYMNALLLFTAFMTVVYMPYDLFVKPVASDTEIWFGFALRGWAAKATEPIHWAIYAFGAYGFWRMRPWMWPWASLYTAQVAFSTFVWGALHVGGVGGWLAAIAGTAPLAALAAALWSARERFQPRRLDLRARYGEWALVTGASAGIGAEFARALALEGMNCVLVARREDRLRALADELERTCKVETRVVEADLSTVRGIDKVVRDVRGLDIAMLVNNAGIGYAGRFLKQDADRLKRMVQLNCLAPVMLTRRIAPAMADRGRGAVVVVGSVAGRQPIPLHAVYSASKSFDVVLGEALWAELMEHGIDVVASQPGPVATEFEQASGEARVDPAADELPHVTVANTLRALGQQPSVVSGAFNYVRANVNRVLPRSLTAFVAQFVMEKQTPESMR